MRPALQIRTNTTLHYLCFLPAAHNLAQDACNLAQDARNLAQNAQNLAQEARSTISFV